MKYSIFRFVDRLNEFTDYFNRTALNLEDWYAVEKALFEIEYSSGSLSSLSSDVFLQIRDGCHKILSTCDNDGLKDVLLRLLNVNNQLWKAYIERCELIAEYEAKLDEELRL